MDVTAVYEIRRVGTDDLYIGITCNPAQRWRVHKCDAKRRRTHLACAIAKHGPDAFKFQVLAAFPTRGLALLAERALVHRLRPRLNMTGGGDAPPAKSAQTRAKISAAAKLRAHPHLQTPEARAKRIATLKETLRKKREKRLQGRILWETRTEDT